MATANKALKKRAQAFAEEHELPYLKALKAVDEPLHQLRDLTDPEELERLGYHPHFRLIRSHREFVDGPSKKTMSSERSAYSELIEERFPATDAHEQIIAEKGLPHFATLDALYEECESRLTAVHGAGATDIWSYRELHRAGLLDPRFPALEPTFHYFGWHLDQGRNFTLPGEGELGVFCVSIAEGRFRGIKELIPVTESELAALRSGTALEPIDLSPISKDATFYLLQDTDAREQLWTKRKVENSAARVTVDSVVGFLRMILPNSSIYAELQPLRPLIRELILEDRATVIELMSALRGAQNEATRELGRELEDALKSYQERVTNFGLDGFTRPIKDRIEALNEGSPRGRSYRIDVPEGARNNSSDGGSEAADILGSLGFSEKEILSAEVEIAIEENRSQLISEAVTLCELLIPDFIAVDYPESKRLVREAAERTLEQSAENFIAELVRKLRWSGGEKGKVIGAKLLQGLSRIDSIRDSAGAKDLLVGIKRHEELIRGYELTYYGPPSHITDELIKLGVKIHESGGFTMGDHEDAQVTYHYYGNCPFHGNNINTLTVEPEKERFSCDSCGRAGDAAVLAQEWENRNRKGWDKPLDDLIEENYS